MKRKNKSRQMNRNFFAVASLILVVSSIFLAVAFTGFVRSLPLESKEVDVSFEISDVLGVDLNTSALTFGTVVPGYSLERNVIIQNRNDFPVEAIVRFSADIDRFLSAPEKTLILPGEEKAISVTLVISKDEKFEAHSGTAIFEMKRKSWPPPSES
jgi:hypothetical protein